jgi:hypothetical protein
VVLGGSTTGVAGACASGHPVGVDEDASSGDLEAIPLVDDGLPDEEVPSRTVRHGRVRRSVLLGLAAAFIIGLGGGVVLGRSAGTDHSGQVAERTPDPPAVTATSSPIRGSALRVLFSHVSPTGAVVVARKGPVSTAEAYGCPGATPTRPFFDDPECRNASANGLQFDFSASGTSWYRLSVLNSHLDNGPNLDLQAVAIDTAVRLVRPDGTTTPTVGELAFHVAAFHSAARIAAVRVTLHDGRTDEMAPVEGWSAFAGEGTNPFRFAVEGIDTQGRLVTRAPVRRWR